MSGRICRKKKRIDTELGQALQVEEMKLGIGDVRRKTRDSNCHWTGGIVYVFSRVMNGGDGIYD